jgi:hypothetical protein
MILDIERYSDKYRAAFEKPDMMSLINQDCGLFPDELLGKKPKTKRKACNPVNPIIILYNYSNAKWKFQERFC